MPCNLGHPCDYCRADCPEHNVVNEDNIVCYCYKCDKAILVGDTYYDIFDEPFCEDCIAEAERKA